MAISVSCPISRSIGLLLTLGLVALTPAQNTGKLARALEAHADKFPIVRLKYSRQPLPFQMLHLEGGRFTFEGKDYVGVRLIAPPKVAADSPQLRKKLSQGYDFAWAISKGPALDAWGIFEVGSKEIPHRPFYSVFGRWQDPEHPDRSLNNSRRILQFAANYIHPGGSYIAYFELVKGDTWLALSPALYERETIRSAADFYEFLQPVMKIAPSSSPNSAQWDKLVILNNWINVMDNDLWKWTSFDDKGFVLAGDRLTYDAPTSLTVMTSINGSAKLNLRQGSVVREWQAPPGTSKKTLDRFVESIRNVFPRLEVTRDGG